MSMVAMGTGFYENEQSLALGASGVTNDKNIFNKPVSFVWKIASTANFNGNWGGGTSIGMQWK